MQDPFYASGILYYPKTHQILLLKTEIPEQPISWSILGGEGKKGEDEKSAFIRIVEQALKLKLKAKDVLPVYDYFHNSLNLMNFVFFAEVTKPKAFPVSKKDKPAWIGFAEILKQLPSSHPIKQDIIVSERVIVAKSRDNAEATEEQRIQEDLGNLEVL